MAEKPTHRRVLKLGGSLLTLDDWPQRLWHWLDAQSPADDVLVVGGGRLADAIRDLNSQRRMDETEVHWMCIAAMAINASRVAEVLEVAMATAAEVRSSPAQARLRVIDPWRFVREEYAGCSGEPLPIGWHVTSDSIAAGVAQVVEAGTLVLLKSCLPSSGEPIAMAEMGYVDAHFPRASAMIERIVCVDLRDESQVAQRGPRRLAGS
jgi:5-(aminomethyl)-3-furanmethanol phosphate kinase